MFYSVCGSGGFTLTVSPSFVKLNCHWVLGKIRDGEIH